MTTRTNSDGRASRALADTSEVRAVRDAVRLLSYLSEIQRPAGVRQLAAALNLSSSSAQRLLATMDNAGVVEQESDTGRYRLGWRVLTYAVAYQRSNGLLQISQGALRSLADETGETACLYVPVPDGRVPIVQVESKHELRWSAEVGRVYPLYLGAAGKALLAYMPDDLILSQVKRCREAKGTAFAQRLARELPQIRQTGVARSSGENLPGVAGIAIPIFNATQALTACLSVYGPGNRVDDALLDRVEPLARRTAQQIGQSLGDRRIGDLPFPALVR